MKKTPGKTPAQKPSTRKTTTPLSKKAARPTARKKSPAKSAAAKVDSQIERLEKVVIDALENLKGKNIVRMDVHALTDVMDTLVIVSGTSSRHVKSLADNAMLEAKKAGFRVYGTEGENAGEWVLVDLGSVVLHVMQPHIREFYDLEKLWSMPVPPRSGQTGE